ncbi:MAG: deoxyribonuclease IV [Candidatus Babeliales bacterium]
MKQKKQSLLLGAHMSIAGGLQKAIERGESIGCTCIQIFTKSNKQWAAKKLTEEDINNFKNAAKNSTIIKSIVAHAGYLINIGSPNELVNKKSVESLMAELLRCEMLNIPYLILHPGAHLYSSESDCINLIAKNLNLILSENPGNTTILLENTAGQGSNIGYTFEQLKKIYEKVIDKKRVNFCLDTCHAFAAGYDFSTPKEYQQMWIHFDETLGLENLKAIHINDSKFGLGLQKDRHANIGEGKIDLEAFRLLFNDERFFDVPKILETPKEEGLKEDIKNMNTIKNLLSSSTRKKLIVF